MSKLTHMIKKIFQGREMDDEYAVVGERLKQIEHDPHRHEYNYEVLDEMHFDKAELKHARRVEHNARDFWNDRRADHPDGVYRDQAPGLHPSFVSDRKAEHDLMIKAKENDRLFKYTSELPIIKAED